MLSGIIRISLYPLMAATMASAIPVLPDVASMRVSPGLITPLASAAAILVVKFQVESSQIGDMLHESRLQALEAGSRGFRDSSMGKRRMGISLRSGGKIRRRLLCWFRMGSASHVERRPVFDGSRWVVAFKLDAGFRD